MSGHMMLDRDILVVFCFLNAFEIWPDKKSGLLCKWPYKRDDFIKGMASLEGGNLFVFFFLNAFEI
jgi:hypothetical protein